MRSAGLLPDAGLWDADASAERQIQASFAPKDVLNPPGGTSKWIFGVFQSWAALLESILSPHLR